jgi:ArsR family transcriptional regulator, lead/cadmium/zinc/bismuth-responsive transcriptional repressor
VKPRRSGTSIYYSLDDHHVAVLFREAEYHADHVHSLISDHGYLLP